MTYTVKEVFLTLQGEGAQTGRTAVFCRFAGCNLWSGREQDRAKATCTFCDTDFRGTNGPGGGKYPDADALADRIASTWPTQDSGGRPYVICTGGEPLLQLDVPLIEALHRRGFEVAVETNGDELKLVYPQPEAPPEWFAQLDFQHFFLQPMDGPDAEAHTRQAIAYCIAHPRWRLSIQTHKLLGIP
jgi:organic radical activating enzyme